MLKDTKTDQKEIRNEVAEEIILIRKNKIRIEIKTIEEAKGRSIKYSEKWLFRFPFC